MTALLHATIPATLVYKTTGKWWMMLPAVFLGALADLINNKYYHLLPKVPKLYNKLHRPWLWLKGWKLALVLIVCVLLSIAAYMFGGLGWFIVAIAYPLHVAMDYDFHTDDDHIKNLEWMVVIEVVCWLALLCWWFGL